ncbi:MAG TPA: UDP-3-O-(3-hydroxymyristoyl)glucosamine N-acyltransferase [Candidatus Methylomirabilis sp.]|nr:UDP-3-O-(3-hydroxymyristoyl)glucosamine N-acyltransferase [Candidatus Methylomirabilis sp.]
MRRPRAASVVPLSEIAAAVGGRQVGAETSIQGVSSLDEAEAGDLAYLDDDRFTEAARACRASALLVVHEVAGLGCAQIVVAEPRLAFVRVVERFFTSPRRSRGVSAQVVRGADVRIGPDASIWPFVTLGNRVTLGARVTLYPGVFVGDDTTIGDDSILYPNVTVRDGSVIGQRVTIHSGTVIGSDGFGYVQHEGRHHKIPQLGIVIVEDDVELGANVTVDRATFGRTVIGHGTKVDNLVHIGHNVTVGPHSILVAQVGISGSTRLGSYVVVGGQAGLVDHIEIGDRAMIGAQAGVIRNVGEGEIVVGTPAAPHDVGLRAHALLLRLPELRQQLRELASRVRALEAPPEPQRKTPRRRK